MVETIQMRVECLYLLKEGQNEIYVNNCQLLKQHQINGLRFLFMLFKKNKPGAIVNFPRHCGKSVTVALFLYAVRNILEKPVLILCKNENEMCIWRENLLKWTDFNNDDIIIESSKVLKGKKIFIKNIDNLASYQQHSWSIVIIKDDSINKEISRISNAQYKIWISSTDMKNSLTSDLITNQINENKSKKTRKNKDDTGTKIKRSRITMGDDLMEMPNKNECIATIHDTKNKNIVVNNGNEHNEFKVNDTLIKNLRNDKVREYNKPNIGNSIEYRHNASEVFTADMEYDINTTMEIDFTEPMSFGNAINEVVKNENKQEENSTKLAIDLKNNQIDLEVEIKKDTVENTDKKEEVLDKYLNISQSKQNVSKENYKDNIENVGTTVDGDRAQLNDSIQGHKDVDTMLSELEERTLKKFKGSLLDSIF
ncbi:serine protease HtrA-like isoform X2 [Vanessa tameamea]|uniref:Serine protease HtrA-like isoform X2 n=1 Tax=Vanessa tameamea TaxID=334116 RepID=A0ABM4AKL7_VANTA